MRRAMLSLTFSKWVITALVLLLVEVRADASAYSCVGKIDIINQPWDGSVNLTSTQIYGDPAGRTLCNLRAAWKGVDPAVCKGWLTTLLLAKINATLVNIQYVDATTSCSQQPAYDGAGFPWAIWAN